MKLNKNNLQIVTLLITTVALVLTLFSLMDSSLTIRVHNEFVLIMSTTLVALLFTSYSLSVMRRINPKQYIYISYSKQDKDLAFLVSKTLNEQFEKLSKYRFEIISGESVPFGEDISTTIQGLIKKSTMSIILVSKNYVDDRWCLEEFASICNEDKKMIPVVIDSFEDLSRLPKDISRIKALPLLSCSSDKDFQEQLLLLAKDLIRRRKD